MIKNIVSGVVRKSLKSEKIKSSIFLFQMSAKDESTNDKNDPNQKDDTADDEDIEVLRATAEASETTTIIGESINETGMNGDNLEDTISVTDLLDDEEIENILEDKCDQADDEILR